MTALVAFLAAGNIVGAGLIFMLNRRLGRVRRFKIGRAHV